MKSVADIDEFNGIEKDMTRAYRRKKNVSKAKRKRSISRSVYGIEWYDNLHEYSKNKVHCSCNLCRFRPVWDPDNESMQDVRNKEAMRFREREYLSA